MTGNELKKKLFGINKSQKDIADLLGVTPQSLSSVLSAKDVRSGTIEKIAHVLNMPVSFFYGENLAALRQGDFSAALVHGDANISASEDIGVLHERIKALQELVNEKERTIKILMGKNS